MNSGITSSVGKLNSVASFKIWDTKNTAAGIFLALMFDKVVNVRYLEQELCHVSGLKARNGTYMMEEIASPHFGGEVRGSSFRKTVLYPSFKVLAWVRTSWNMLKSIEQRAEKGRQLFCMAFERSQTVCTLDVQYGWLFQTVKELSQGLLLARTTRRLSTSVFRSSHV